MKEKFRLISIVQSVIRKVLIKLFVVIFMRQSLLISFDKKIISVSLFYLIEKDFGTNMSCINKNSMDEEK